MKVRRRNGLRNAVIALVLVFAGAVALLRSQLAWDRTCALLRDHLPSLTGMQVEISRCEISPLTRTLSLTEVRLTEPGAAPVFSSARIDVSLSAIQPFFGEVELSRLTLVEPRVRLDLTRGGLRSSRSNACALEGLRRVAIERLEVVSGSVAVDAGASGGFELGGVDLAWKVRRGVAEFKLGAEHGELRLGRGRGELAVSKLQLEGGLDAQEERLELSSGELGVEDVTLTLDGRVEQLCDPALFLDGQLFLPVKTLARATNHRDAAGGHLWGRASLSGKAKDPVVTLDVVANQVEWGEYRPGDFTARALLRDGELTVQELLIPSGEGEVKLSGHLHLSGKLPVRARLEAQDAQLAPLLARAGLPGAWVNFAASGKGQASGQLWPLQLSGDLDLAVSRFALAARPYDAPASGGREILRFDRGRVHGPVRLFADRVELPELKLESGQSRAQAAATLYYDEHRGLELTGAADPLELSDFGQLAELSIAGKGSASFEVRGPYEDVEISSTLSLRDMVLWDLSLGVVQAKLAYADEVLSFPALNGQKGKSRYSGTGELRFDGEPVRLTLDARFPGGRTEDLVDLLAGLTTAVGVLQGEVEGEASARLQLTGTPDDLRGSAEVELASTRYYGRRLGDGALRVAFLPERALEHRLALEGPLGSLRLDGTYWLEGPLALRFWGEGLALGELVGPERARELEVEGTLRLRGEIEGDATTPVVNGYLTSPRVVFAGRDLGALHLEGRMQGRALQVFGRPFEDARAFLELTAQAPYPYRGNFSLRLPEIRPLLPQGAIAQGVSGSIGGAVAFRGELADRRSLALDATLDLLRLSRGDFTGQNHGPVSLSYASGRFGIDAFSFRAPNTELTAQGFAGPAAIDLKILGSADMRLLESFVPQMERASGRVDLTASAGGTFEAPRVAGSAELSDVRLQIRDRPISLRGLSGRVTFTESRVLFEDMHGILNEGRVALSGGVEHARFAVRAVDAQMQLDEVQIRSHEDLPFTAVGELHLYGRREALTLAGDLDIHKLKYDKPLELSLVRDLARAPTLSLPSDEARPRKWLSFDIGVHLKDVRVDNNLARGRVLGDLRLTGDNLKPGLLGTISAGEGSQAFYLRNQFAISQALVEFKSRDSIQGIFDMHAETQVREFLVRLHAFGRTSDPKVILTAEPDLPEADILTLLTFGVTSRDRSDTANAAVGAGTLAADAFIAASGLDKEVKRFLPKFLGLRDLKFHISTTYDSVTGGMEPSAQFETKWLTDAIRLGVNQPIARGTRSVYVESKLSERLSLQFQWDNENRAEAGGVGNMGLDFKWRWEVE